MSERPQVLLLSSNLRRRYAEDILTALALPRGAVIQFRYGAAYLAPNLRDRIQQARIRGATAVLGYIADHTAAVTEAPFIVPVRVAQFVQAELIADMFVIKLRTLGYPDINYLSTDMVRLRESSKRFYDGLLEMNSHNYYPAVTAFPQEVATACDEGLPDDNNNDSRRWLRIVERLALHQTFRHTYFMQMNTPIVSRGRPAEFDASGQLKLRDGQTAKLNVSFYTEEYLEDSTRTLECNTDGRFLRVSSDDSYQIALRYDSVEFWLQPSTQNFDALARVTVRLGNESAAPGGATSLTSSGSFPVHIRRSRPRLAVRLAVTAAGAILVALPAILGQGSSLKIRIVSAVLGAVLLAFAAVALVGTNG